MESIRRSIGAVAVSAVLILPASAATILPVSNAPIALDAESSEYDRNADRLLFRQVRITQGDLSIVADQAVANNLDFAASTWEFEGRVKLDGQGARIHADKASVRFSNHQLVHATASGGPATFERDPSPELRGISGDAEVIDYDARASRLELRGSARLIDGANRFNGHKLVYLMEEDRLLASSDGATGDQVSVVITPSTIDEIRGEDDDLPAPQPGEGEDDAAARPEVETAPPPGGGEPGQ